jgi:3-oxoacyl-[acyl-carrier-protein] synthase III
MALKNKALRILGTGSYVPDETFSNDQIEAITPGVNAEWTEKTLGIKTRHVIEPGESSLTMAIAAAMKALDNAKLKGKDLDLIIVATATPSRIGPSTACMVQEAISAFNAAAFDLNAVCAGFIYGLSLAGDLLSAGRYRKILVIGVDCFSTITNWESRNCVFFGDGAGAAIVGLSEDPKATFVSMLFADGRGGDAWTVQPGKRFFQMDGKAVYKKATEVLPEAIRDVCNAAGISRLHIDYVLPHQPSIGILKVTAEKLGIPFEKVLTNMDRYANTSAATIPILLDENNRAGKFKDGNILVFAAIGSGWAWGAAILRWTSY